MSFGLRPASEADIPFIMEVERLPGNERVVGRWEHDAHRAEMARASSAYFVGEREGKPVGFVMLQGLDDAAGNVVVRRIIVQQPGTGAGRDILEAAVAWCFGLPRTHRVWLNVLVGNERAYSVYAKFGFVEEGILRESVVNPAGERASVHVMSILRSEWDARAAQAVAIQ